MFISRRIIRETLNTSNQEEASCGHNNRLEHRRGFLIQKVFRIYIAPLLLNEHMEPYSSFVTFLNPNISMHILHTVLFTFPKVLTREFV